MIISRTPFRVSLFGGGTDYPAWYREYGGAVLGMAINKYCYISVRRLPPFFEHRSRVVYSKVELVNDVADIQHPSVRGILSEKGITEGLEIHHDADLPARSGLGSSSSFTVGLLNALYALQSRMITKRELAGEAIHIEREVLKESVGCQDQIWAAYGGFHRIDFHPDDAYTMTPLILNTRRRDELLRSLMLFFTGFSRFASEFATEQVKNINQRKTNLRMMRALVDSAVAIIVDERKSLHEMGEMLHESWMFKRELADGLSNCRIDEIYEAGRSAGAVGGKLLGAGGGGFLLFFVAPENQESVREKLKGLICVSVNVDHEGSKIVLYQPDGL